MPRNDKERSTFQGFQGPNYTIVPDELFDQLMVELSGAELKVLLYIVRRTFGFKRDSDNISLSQMLNGIQTRDGRTLDRGVGLSKKTLLQALNSLEERNVILTQRRQSAERGNEPTAYRLNVREPLGREETPPPLGEKLRQGVGEEIPPRARGKNSPTQDTVKQETVKNLSKFRKVDAEQDTETAGPGPTHQPSDASRSTRGPEAIGTTLARRRPPPVASAYSTDRQTILAYIQDFAREFNDQAPLRSSVSRAYNIYRRSGTSLETFIAAMYSSRAKVKERTGSIRATAPGTGTSRPVKTKMGYWYACLERELGLAPTAETEQQW